MRRLRNFAYSAAALLIAITAVGVFLPSGITATRSTTIDAHASTVFALLETIRQVNKWSPWTENDANANIVFAGPDSGAGATMRWSGSIIGNGGQVIVDSVGNEFVVSDLEIDGRAPARSTLELHEHENGTLVTWALERAFGINILDRFIGQIRDGGDRRDLDRGLRNLKLMAESLPRADFSDLELELVVIDANEIAYISSASMPDPASISAAAGNAYFTILQFIDRHELHEAGAPLIISRGFNGPKLAFDAAIPVRGDTAGSAAAGSTVRIGTTYGGPVIRVRHTGPYSRLLLTHDKIAAYLAARNIERIGDAWESYVSDPARTPEQNLLTEIYYPVKR